MKQISYIELSNFRSYRKRCRINLPERGLVLIEGVNHDTGGGSGSGKSSIPLATVYALGECPYPATALKSWWDDEPMTVDLGFRDGTAIERGTKGIKFWTEGSQMKGSAAQKEAALASYLGIDVETALTLTYRGQGKPGFFLSMTDSAKKEFLTKILDLGKFEREVDRSENLARTLEASLLVSRAERDAFSASLAAIVSPDISDAKARLVDVLGEIKKNEEKIAELREDREKAEQNGRVETRVVQDSFAVQLQAARDKVSQAQAAKLPFVEDRTEISQLEAIAAECQKRLNRLASEHDQKVRVREQALSQMQARINSFTQTLGAEAGLKREEARLTAEIEKLKADKCPTCQRDWDHAQAHRHELEVKLATAQGALALCEAAREDVAATRADILAVPQVERDPKVEQLQKVKDETTVKLAAALGRSATAKSQHEAQQRVGEAEAKADLAILTSEVAGKLSEVTRRMHERIDRTKEATDQVWFEIHTLRSEESGLRGALAEADAVAKQAARLQQQLAAAEARLAPQEAELAREHDFQQLVGREGFLGSIFDEVLEQISDEANRLLAAVANTRHVTIRFQSEGLTQKGTVRREIRPIVTIGGFEAPMEAGLSGGMYAVVQLVVDLALGAVITERSGVRLGWLILDEALDGLGPVEKDSALEILRQYAQDRLVLVIDHSSEFKSSFTHIIQVEMSNGETILGSL